MNKKQADDIINLIQSNIVAKKQNVEKIYNQDVVETSNFSSVNVENEFSLLGKMQKTLSGDISVEQAIVSYIASNKYNDSNINQIAKQYKSKVKSVKSFEKELVKIFNSKGLIKKFNRFIYASYVAIEHTLNTSNANAIPSTLLKLMNDNRKAIGLDTVETFDKNKDVLSSYTISHLVEGGRDVQLDALVKNINGFTKKYGYEIVTPTSKADALPVVKQLYNVILNNFTKDTYFDFVAKNNEHSSDISLGLQKFDKMTLQEKNEVRDSVVKVATLLLTNRVLALTSENKENYIQLSKIIRYDVCNQLCNLVDKFNDCCVTYAIAQIVENNFVKICDDLKLSATDSYHVLSNNGATIMDRSNLTLNKLALCEQMEEVNNRQKTFKKVFEMDFQKIEKEDYYVAVVNKYIEKFNKLLSEKKFVANSKIDLNAENLKVRSVSADAKKLISMIEAKGHATEEQFKVFIDAHAYSVVSNSVLHGLAKQYFDIDLNKANEIQIVENQQVVTAQEVVNEPAKRLIPEIIYSDELTPVIRKYEPNFVIVDEGHRTNENATSSTDNKSKILTNHDDIIEVEAVDSKTVSPEKVEDKKESAKQHEKVEQPTPIHEETKQQDLTPKPQQNFETKQIDETKKVVDKKPKVQQPQKPKTKKVPTLKEQKMDEEKQKLNEQNEKQKREIEELKKQLEQAKKQNFTTNNASAEKSNKSSILSSKIEEILTESFKSSIKSLANLDFDLKARELNKNILHTNTLSPNARKLLTSLNNYISLTKSENEQVRKNSFVDDNAERTVKDIMKFEFYLKKLIKTFADKVADTIESDDKPVEVLITDTIEKYCSKYVEVMAQNKKAEVARLKEMYGDDEYELESRLEMLNDKYYGNNGLLNSLKNSYLSLLTKDIIISQIKEIDHAEANEKIYVFDKQKVNKILDEITGNAETNEQENVFTKE